jgi:hypothetical protein
LGCIVNSFFSMFSFFFYPSLTIMTLTLGSSPRLKHKNANGLENWMSQYWNTLAQVWENAWKWIPNTLNEKHFGNYTLKGALNLWDESANKKCDSNWAPNIPFEILKYKFWKLIQVLHVELWTRNYDQKNGQKSNFQPSNLIPRTIKFKETHAKWPLN